MSTYRSFIILLIVALFSSPSAEVCRAAVTFLGPTSYLSKADSPFPVDGSSPTFHVEDFEDGAFNSPGIVLPSLPEAQGYVLPAGQPLTNSVDSDDGTIDGMGRNGRALMSTIYTNNLVNPPTYSSYVGVGFDSSQLGYLPTDVGFVWTYGPLNSVVRLGVYDGNSNEIGYKIFPGIGNGNDNDTTDDRFFGVLSSEGIGSILITTSYPGDTAFFEMDHFQYGLLVPEQRSEITLVIAMLLMALGMRLSRS